MDPLATYQGTGRSIQLGFDIINDSVENARFNLANVGQFLKFLYPVYESGRPSLQNVLKAAPVLSMKWTNLISNASGEELVGYINGPLSYSPDMGEGGFTTREITEWAGNDVYRDARMNTDLPASAEVTVDKFALGNYIPKKVNLSFAFTVIHTHLGGWSPPPGAQALSTSEELTGKTQTFVFGGDKTIEAAFPNIVQAPPPPADMAKVRAKADFDRMLIGVGGRALPQQEGGDRDRELAEEARRENATALAGAEEERSRELALTTGQCANVQCWYNEAGSLVVSNLSK